MTNIELISFILTIASFIVSSLLGVFAIWLSKHFDSKSSQTLSDVQKLTTEIKSLTSTSINQHESITVKVIDKLLNDSPYGLKNINEKNTDTNNTDILLIELLKQQNEKFEDFKDQMTKIMTIQTVVDVDAKESEVLLLLTDFMSYPAYYILINAIVIEKIEKSSDIQMIQDKYGVVSRWEQGVDRLLEEEILIGTEENFVINHEYLPFLNEWLEINRPVINQLIEKFRKVKLTLPDDDDTLTREEREEFKNISQKLIFKSIRKTPVNN